MLRIRVAATLALACLVSFLVPGSSPSAINNNIVISQVYGGGGNSGATLKNDFIELFNPGPTDVSLDGWSVQYGSANGISWTGKTNLSGTIAAGGYYLVQEAAGAGGTVDLPAPDLIGAIAMGGSAGKVALARTTTTLIGSGCPFDPSVVDFVGYGSTNCSETASTAALSNATAALRAGNGCTDTDNNSADFTVGVPTPRNSSSPLNSCGGGPTPTNPTATGSATPASVLNGDTSLLTVTVTAGTNPTSTGVTVAADLSSIGGSSTQSFYDDASHGDVTAADLVFSYEATVTATAGAKSLPVTIADAQARTGSTSIALTVTAPVVLADIVISQVYGGGGNSGATYKNDFIELYNQGDTPASLAGWSVQYASATGSTWQFTLLSGAIQGHGYYLVREAAGSGGTQDLPTPDAMGGIAMSATTGKVALVASTAALTGTCPAPLAGSVDFVGFGTANCFEGSGPAPAPSNVNAAIRAGGGSIDTDNNAADFTAGAPTPRNSAGIAPVATGQAAPVTVANNGTSLLTVTVTPGDLPPSTGITVTADLTAIGGSATQSFYDDGTNGDVAAGDSTYSFSAVVTGTAGIYNLPATAIDAQTRSAHASIRLAIETPMTPIYTLQGSGSTSSFTGQLVTTRGIVTALKYNGLFIQVADGEGDGDAATSDGIFVFTSSAPPSNVLLGDEVHVVGTIQEFQPAPQPPVTEISGGPAIGVISSGHALPMPIILQPSFTTPTGGLEQLERFEGMRVTADITAVTGTDGTVNEPNATGNSNGDFYAVIKGVARPVREPGYDPSETLPPTAPCCVPAFDGNPEKIRVDSDAQLGAPKVEIVAGQWIDGMTGVLDYGFFAYTILPDPGTSAPQGNAAAVPLADPPSSQFTVGSYNMERFFDATNQSGGDDVVMTVAGLERRLSKASLAIRNILRMPDVLGAIEIENLNALQAIAARVNADAVAAGQPDPQYVAYLEEGNDPGGIDVGFLVKSSRVDVVDAIQLGKDTTYHNVDTNTDDLLNDRPPLVLHVKIHRPVGDPYPVTVIVNHLRSLNGMTDPGTAGERVRDKRRLQAEFLANYIQERQALDPTERIISVGDYNAFQFNDGWVDVIGTIKGTPTTADQVVTASTDLVNPDLVNTGDLLSDEAQYSYSFDGNAQAIDHILVNQAAYTRFDSVAYAHLDADFPESFRSDANRPERLSDHDAAVAYFVFAGQPVLTLLGDPVMTVEAYGRPFVDPGATAFDEEFGALPVTVSGTVDVNTLGDYTLTYSATNGYFTTTRTRLVHVVDTTAPAISNFMLSTNMLWPPNHDMMDVGASYQATDGSDAVTCSLAVESNEPQNGLGDGDTDVDWAVLDPHAVSLRAERSGTGTGRVYGVTLTCEDPSGNRVMLRETVVVPLRIGKP